MKQFNCFNQLEVTMGAYIAFASFVFNMVVLAVVLSVFGLCVNKLISRLQTSRTASKMNAEALVAAARARARSNGHSRQVKASLSF